MDNGPGGKKTLNDGACVGVPMVNSTPQTHWKPVSTNQDPTRELVYPWLMSGKRCSVEGMMSTNQVFSLESTSLA